MRGEVEEATETPKETLGNWLKDRALQVNKALEYIKKAIFINVSIYIICLYIYIIFFKRNY